MEYQQVNGTKCSTSTYNFIPENISAACKLNEACGKDVHAKLNARVESGGYAALISLVNIFVSALVVLFDAIFRFAFLGIRMFCRNKETNASFSVLVRRVFTRRIRASYVTRQLNILSGVFLLMMAWLRFYIARLNIDGFSTAVTKSTLRSTLKTNVALSALFRALEIINLLLEIKNFRRPLCHQHVQNRKGSATIPDRVFSDGIDAVAGVSIRCGESELPVEETLSL